MTPDESRYQALGHWVLRHLGHRGRYSDDHDTGEADADNPRAARAGSSLARDLFIVRIVTLAHGTLEEAGIREQRAFVNRRSLARPSRVSAHSATIARSEVRDAASVGTSRRGERSEQQTFRHRIVTRSEAWRDNSETATYRAGTATRDVTEDVAAELGLATARHHVPSSIGTTPGAGHVAPKSAARSRPASTERSCHGSCRSDLAAPGPGASRRPLRTAVTGGSGGGRELLTSAVADTR